MRPTNSSNSGATLAEILIATAGMGIVSAVTFALLNAGTIQFAKNSAINLAHQQARIAVIEMESDLHASVSLPQLCDASRNPISGSGPAAGISFQTFAGGPFQITVRAAAGQNRVTLNLGSFQPKAGQRLVIPTHQIEIDLATDAPGTGGRAVTLVSNLPRSVEIYLDNAGVAQFVNVVGFITDRMTYVVSNKELRCFKTKNATNYSVLANNITSPSPFSTPQTPAGAPYYRFVAAINLSTSDASTSNRGFKAANMFLNAQVPCRARLCAYQ